MVNMGVPARIKALRKKHKLSREVFASFLGVTPYTVYRWEAGRIQPRRSMEKMTEEIEMAMEARRRLIDTWSPLTPKVWRMP